MPNIYKAKCGDKEVSINVRRPSWCRTEQNYNIIHQIAKNGKEQAKKEKLDAIGISKRIAEGVFEYIGGDLNRARIEAESKVLHGENVNTYRNTCATKVSFALNNSEIKIDGKDLEFAIETSGTKWKGKDGYYYYTGVSGIKNLLIKNWKEKGLRPFSQTNNEDFYKVFYNHKTEPYSTLSELRIAEIRQDNQKFLGIMQGLNKKGIVTMDIDGWGDAGGHTTLWNGSKFLDDENYLNDERPEVFVRELCFFELK